MATTKSSSVQPPKSSPVRTPMKPSEEKKSALAGVGRPQNSVCCVSSMLNLASRSAEKAAMTKQRKVAP